MIEIITSYLRSVPPMMATFITAMLPVTELRASIPLGIEIWHLTPLKAAIASILGNLVPAVFILYFFNPIQTYLSQHSTVAKKFFAWLFNRTRYRFDAKYRKYGAFALSLFVAIPLPVTGAWTGALAAWLFGIKSARALAFIFIGLIVAAIIVTGITLGFGTLFI